MPGRRWHLEDWRKIYTRMDADWLALPCCARALASDLIKYAKDDGTIVSDLHGREPWKAVARLLAAHDFEEKFVKAGIEALLADHYLVLDGSRLYVRNHGEAQEKLSPEARRKRRQRDKERDSDRDAGGTGGVTERGTSDVTSHGTNPPIVLGHSAGVESSRVESEKASLAGEHAREDRVEPPGVPPPPPPPPRVDPEGRFLAAWYGATGGRAAGNPSDNIAAWRLCVEAAERLGREPEPFAREVIAAYVAEVKQARADGKHHGAPCVADFAGSRGSAGWFNRALDRLDGNAAPKPPAEEYPDVDEVVRRAKLQSQGAQP